LHKLTQSDPHPNDAFGVSVAMHGQIGLVGAYVGDSAVLNSGVAYINNLQPGVGALTTGGDASLLQTGSSEPQQASLLPEVAPRDILNLKVVDDLFEQLGNSLSVDI
jgi:hypothetical protein